MSRRRDETGTRERTTFAAEPRPDGDTPVPGSGPAPPSRRGEPEVTENLTALDGAIHRLLEAVVDLTSAEREQYLAHHATHPDVARLVLSMVREEEGLGTFLDRGVLPKAIGVDEPTEQSVYDRAGAGRAATGRDPSDRIDFSNVPHPGQGDNAAFDPAEQPKSARGPLRIGRWRLPFQVSGLGSLALVASIAAVILTSVVLVRAHRAERQSRADAQVTRQTLDFVVDLFEAIGPEPAQGQATSARQLLDAGATRARDADMAPRHRAEILATMARVQMRLGLDPEAVTLATESLAIHEDALGDDDPALLSGLELLANALRRAGRGADAEPYLERLVALARNADDPMVLADALDSHGNVLGGLGRFDQAEAMHREALTLRTETPGTSPADVASSRNHLGLLLHETGRHLEAEPHFRKAAVALTTHLGDMHPSTADALNNLGNVFQRTGRYTEALATQQHVLAIRTATLGPDHPATAASHDNLGTLLRDLGRLTEAEQQYRRALEIRRDVLGTEHAETIESVANLGNALRQQGRFAEAEPHLVEALAHHRRHFGPDGPSVARSRRSLAILWRETGRLPEARSALEEVMAKQRRLHGNDHHAVATTLHHLAIVEHRAGHDERAEGLLHEAVTLRRALGPAQERRLSDSLVALAEVVAKRGETDQRDTLVAEALAIRQRLLPEDHPDLRAITASIGALRDEATPGPGRTGA